MKLRTIAFYLPQFHPIPENDNWYGKGYTEWVNVAQARPMFHGHYQPHIPADLGFYDLRYPEVRRLQSKMALSHGVSAFCYWTYWFGGGRRLLTMPMDEMLKDKEVKIPFCIGWANHSWEKKSWDPQGNGQLLMEQSYPGREDYRKFFETYLRAFRDERYFRVEGKPLVCVFQPLHGELREMLDTWRELAVKNGLEGFYFVGRDSGCRAREEILDIGFDAVYEDDVFNVHHECPRLKKALLLAERSLLKRPTVFSYEDAIRYMVKPYTEEENTIPLIAPNWDHTPRTGADTILLKDCEPKLFYRVCRMAMEAVKKKPEEKRLVFIKSWNEWGEGNHMEPDRRYGKGYLKALKKALEDQNGIL